MRRRRRVCLTLQFLQVRVCSRLGFDEYVLSKGSVSAIKSVEEKVIVIRREGRGSMFSSYSSFFFPFLVVNLFEYLQLSDNCDVSFCLRIHPRIIKILWRLPFRCEWEIYEAPLVMLRERRIRKAKVLLVLGAKKSRK